MKKTINDSEISEGSSVGRTKATAIVQQVLDLASIEHHVKHLISTGKKFSVSCDASNRRNKKLFHIVIYYNSIDKGIIEFLLDFYQDPDETSLAISERIKKGMSQTDLKISSMITYGADNANVNYGQNQSVFTELKKENSFIIKAHWNCHILHNTAKYGLIDLPLDVEKLINKLYSHFSLSAKRAYFLNHVSKMKMMLNTH